VGRGEEIRLVRAALAADEPSFSVLFVHGPGGVGKTALLEAFADEAEAAGVRPVRLDMHDIEPTPPAFVERFAAGLGREPHEVTLDSLGSFGRVMVLIDTLELAAPLDTWLRETFVVHLPSDALVVIAGREPPSPRWLADAAWRGLSRVAPLGDLPPADTRRYLARRGVDERVHARLLELTHGHPLALSLVVDVLDQRPGIDAGAALDLVDAPDVVRMLMERFVGEVPDRRHREALAVCAHVRFTTEDLLRVAMGGDDAGDLLAWLRSRSFVEEGRHGLFPHDLARDVLDTDLRWRDRVAYEDLHRRVRRHLASRVVSARGRAQQRAVADVLFLHRLNPVMRPLFDWRRLGRVHGDRLAPGGRDREAVVALAQRHHGAAEAELVRHWLDRQPDAFVVFRQGERDVAGFTAFLRLDAASTDDLAGDPVAAALWAYAGRHDPPRPGEAVTATRFLVDAERGQARPSASWTAFAIAHVLHTMTTERLAWDFVAAFRSLDVEPLFAYIDHHRVPEAEVAGGDTHPLVFAHDWRRVGWEAFMDLMGERELDDGPGAGVLAPPAGRGAAGH
jgi:hypothetical protein